METEARKYAHIEAPMASLNKLPPLRSPQGDYDNDKMPLKKIVLNRRSQGTQSLVRKRPSK